MPAATLYIFKIEDVKQHLRATSLRLKLKQSIFTLLMFFDLKNGTVPVLVHVTGYSTASWQPLAFRCHQFADE
jgi:hypothetical protein